MIDDLEFKLDGLEALSAKFESIDYDLKRKGGRAALRKAANVVANAAKQKAMAFDDPETKEKIYKNIGIRWDGRMFKRTGDLGFRVGVLGGAKQYVESSRNVRAGRVGQTYEVGDKKRPGGDTWYWRLVEFGTSKMQARPFMRPALTENIDRATKEFVVEYEKAIDRAIKRARKK